MTFRKEYVLWDGYYWCACLFSRWPVTSLTRWACWIDLLRQRRIRNPDYLRQAREHGVKFVLFSPLRPEWAEQISEVPAKAMRILARRMATHKTFITMSWFLLSALHLTFSQKMQS